MAELHATKRIRELADVLREEALQQGADLRCGDRVERMIAERVTTVAQQMGVTPRTALATYVTEDHVRGWGLDLGLQLQDAELAAHDTPPVIVDQRDGLMVLAPFGVCATLALRNADRRQHADPMIVVKDAADSTTQVAICLFEKGAEPAPIGGLTVVVGRKVISMTLEALRRGWWDCTCEQPHRPDGGCLLQDRLVRDLAVLGGWHNTGETPATMSAPDRPAAVARRLPGTALPRVEVLREFEESNAKLRQGLAPVLWPFFAPGAGDFFRWRVQLECGCIREVMTHGCDRLPDQVCWPDPLSRRPLPEGQILCPHPDTPPAPYRAIASWDHRREVSIDPAPVDPPDWVDADTWAVIRRDHPSAKAFWSVTLSCGHVTEVVCDLDWKPADGPRRVPAQRQAAMIAEFEEYFASGPADLDIGWREHMRRILADGFPQPCPEQTCSNCPKAQAIVAYQRVGWLVPRPKPAVPVKQPSRDSLESRLRRVDAEAERLRAMLADLELSM